MMVSDDVLIIHASQAKARKFLSLMRQAFGITAHLTGMSHRDLLDESSRHTY